MNSEKKQQLELLPTPSEPHIEPVTPDTIRSIRRRRTLLAAWNFAQDFAGLDHKQCWGPLGIDSSHWTKIRSGDASPPADERFLKFFDVVGNEFPLIWLAEARGYDWTTIQKHRSSEQQRISELEGENRDLKRALGLLWDAQKGKG